MLYKHPGICTKTPIEYPETIREVTEEDKKPQVAKKTIFNRTIYWVFIKQTPTPDTRCGRNDAIISP